MAERFNTVRWVDDPGDAAGWVEGAAASKLGDFGKQTSSVPGRQLTCTRAATWLASGAREGGGM
jgi:hypothetical protein